MTEEAPLASIGRWGEGAAKYRGDYEEIKEQVKQFEDFYIIFNDADSKCSKGNTFYANNKKQCDLLLDIVKLENIQPIK